MDDTRRWQDAHVGAVSPQVAVRMTEEEKQRLEQLRQDLRLTSKGQVIRAALDLLEQLFLATDPVMGADQAETRRVMRRARRAHGVPRVSDLERSAQDDAVARNKALRTSYKHVVGAHGDHVPGGGPGTDAGLPGTAPASPGEVDERQLELPEMPAPVESVA